MNLLDALILVLVAAACVGGFRLGFLARAASWLGMALGLLVAGSIAPSAVSWFHDGQAATVLLIAAAILLLGGLAGQLIGLVAGSRLRISLPRGAGQQADRVLGAAAGLGGVVLAIWLLLPVMQTSSSWPARQIDGSMLAALVADNLPDPPDTLLGLGTLVGTDRWRQILTDLDTEMTIADPPAASGLPEAVVERVRASVMKVEGVACYRNRQGSGFVIADRWVMTNAHVVAGVRRPTVRDEANKVHAATIVWFDSKRDVAILEVPGLAAPPLPLGGAKPGDTGGVFGHPGGEGLRVAPYQIGVEERAGVPDLYDPDGPRQPRRVFFLATELAEGDSGAPLVDPDGEVVGMAFAISTKTEQQGGKADNAAKEVREDEPVSILAIALTAQELRDALAGARTGGERVNADACLQSGSTGSAAGARHAAPAEPGRDGPA